MAKSIKIKADVVPPHVTYLTAGKIYETVELYTDNLMLNGKKTQMIWGSILADDGDKIPVIIQGTWDSHLLNRDTNEQSHWSIVE